MDKNLQYINETQTLVGQKKRTLIDQDTGEVVHVDQITKRVYGTKQFWKVYLMDFLSILGIIDSKQLDVFIYIAENTNQNSNLFIGTYRSISEDVGVGIQVILRQRFWDRIKRLAFRECVSNRIKQREIKERIET